MNVDFDSKEAEWSAEWSAELCECGDDVGTCCITIFMPCVTYGRIAEVLDEGKCSCMAECFAYGMLSVYGWVLSWSKRGKLRKKFGLPGDAFEDCCIHFCCEPCALCQEYRELKIRGLDPSKGWIGPSTAPPQQLMPPSKQLN